MKALAVLLLMYSLNASANPFLDCYNGCLTGHSLGGAIDELFGTERDTRSRAELEQSCTNQCIAATSQQSQPTQTFTNCNRFGNQVQCNSTSY